MASQYVIKANAEGKYDVFYAQLFSYQETEAMYRDLVSNGWEAEDARAEVSRVPRAFAQCNADPRGYSLALCSQFVATYIEPGDLIVLAEQGVGFIVQKKAVA
jgi:hypothetical protein